MSASVCLSLCLGVCLFVCLSAGISLESHTGSLPNFWYVLPMSMAQSSGMFTVGRITYHLEAIFFPIDNAL